jgi:hypothetical protein
MHRAFESRDATFIRHQLDAMRLRRATLAAGDIAPDVLFQEILLSLRIGDTTSAIASVERMLEAVPSNVSLTGLAHPFGAAAVVRAMALRAELAAAGRDLPTARRWATAVVTLWSGADRHLQPLVARMRDVASPTSTR